MTGRQPSPPSTLSRVLSLSAENLWSRSCSFEINTSLNTSCVMVQFPWETLRVIQPDSQSVIADSQEVEVWASWPNSEINLDLAHPGEKLQAGKY